MKLISTLAEIKKQYPVLGGTNIDTLKPYLTYIEGSLIKRIIGPDQFDVFVAAYKAANNNIESIDNENIRDAISICQLVIVNAGYEKALPFLNVTVSSGGITTFSTEGSKPAFQWQINELKQSFIDIAFNGIETLLEHMEENIDDFEAYKSSEQYSLNTSFLINKANDFNKYLNIDNSRYLFSQIAYIMKRVEDLICKKVCSPTFFDSLKNRSLKEKEKELVDNYLKPAIALFTGSIAIKEKQVSFVEGKVVYNFRGSTDNTNQSQALSREQILDTTKELEENANQYMIDALEFIKNNQFEDYEPPVIRKRFSIKNTKESGIFFK